MNKFLYLTVFVLFSMACGSAKKVDVKTDFVVFTLRKTDCRGKCPVYYMEVFKSGKITFEGVKNVDKLGRYEKQLETKAVDRLIRRFEKAHFFDLKDEYVTAIRDLPSTYVGFTNNGKSKTIRDYHEAPKALIDLEALLEAIATDTGWKKIE